MLVIKHCLTKYKKQLHLKSYVKCLNQKNEKGFNFSRYLNLILSEFMGIEIEALFPEWEKPGRMNRSYCIIFVRQEG